MTLAKSQLVQGVGEAPEVGGWKPTTSRQCGSRFRNLGYLRRCLEDSDHFFSDAYISNLMGA